MKDKENKRIYVDVDDVISKTTETYIRIAEEEFGKKVGFEELVTFNLQTSFGLTENEYHYFFDRVHQPDLLLGFEPVDGAVDAITAWAEQGYGINIVTGRPTSARDVTLEWLAAKKVPFDSFVMVDKYNRPGNDPAIAVTKQELAKDTYDLAVEDSKEMALYLAREMAVPVALYDRPWNAGVEEHEQITRYTSWRDIRQQME